VNAGALPLHERVMLAGPAGDIEARIETPANAGAGDLGPGGAGKVAAFGVVCHPHPLFGGTLDNKVVYTLARSFHDLGMPTIRFNFRGVGKSVGSFADGLGETDDTLAVIAAGREKWPGAAVWLAGFSFGGAVAIRAAATAQPARLVAVAPAIKRVSLDGVPVPACPWLIVQGDADELVNAREVVDWANPPGAPLANPPQIALLPGVEHFFHGKLNELREAVTAFAKQ
jgi:alpha/beta superfamily hydrolase